ncbi:hypothetical protein EDB84DRAFT_1434042 [Lactarius hengduanensis]|nr:hypothetical protein EDB84DRAFT_1434042 [Lactarius hengduanensis]
MTTTVALLGSLPIQCLDQEQLNDLSNSSSSGPPTQPCNNHGHDSTRAHTSYVTVDVTSLAVDNDYSNGGSPPTRPQPHPWRLWWAHPSHNCKQQLRLTATGQSANGPPQPQARAPPTMTTEPMTPTTMTRQQRRQQRLHVDDCCGDDGCDKSSSSRRLGQQLNYLDNNSTTWMAT